MAIGLTPLKIKCKKNLFSFTGEQNFTKGKEYETDGYINYYNPIDIPEYIVVLNDQKDKHKLGNWAKHFKLIK